MADEFDNPDVDPDDKGLVTAQGGSPLANLRDRRRKAKAALHIDLEVPRYDPPLWVRFKPVDGSRVETVNKSASKSKDPDRVVIANATVLAAACVGVFDDPDSDPEDWPKFDATLAEALEMGITGDRVRAVDVVRELYLTDGDITSTAEKLAQWSGYSSEAIERDVEGN